jgi:glyceraldehyde 3-phosphate dehydrogenase
MTVKIGINGFGRIGRNILRALHESPRDDMEIVAINDLAPAPSLAHLLKYDSVHGRFPGTVTATDTAIDIGNGPITVTAERDPAKLPWGEQNIDVVLECTGFFRSPETAGKHIEAGAKRVLISAPGSGVKKTIVYGVNHDILTGDDTIVSNASCTTNCLAPIAKVLDDAFGIENGFMTTIHAYTGAQPTLDAVHKDPFRGRAAAMSMIPTTTGAAKALSLVLPKLEGKIDGVALRVPTPNVSAVDLVVNVAKSVTVEQVNAALSSAAGGALSGVLAVTDDKIVSIDMNHDAHSSTAMLNQTYVNNGTLIRVMSWYDNEWGFSNRMLDTAGLMGSFL